nr:reverse transcriptase domain-containing protein [Tanacetum cinerariifolium]
MLPVTQIDTFYNGLTLRHRDTINVAAGGTFMKRRPEERYDLIENMTAHHNDWDTFVQRSESSSSITSSSSDPDIVALKAEMAKINKNLMKVLQINQQVKAVIHNCETCGGPHSYNDCPATVGQTQNVYAAVAYNQGGNSYQSQGIKETIMEFLRGTTKEETNSSKELVMVKTRLQLIKHGLIKPQVTKLRFIKPRFLNPLADLGQSINLMPLSVWNKLSLPELSPTCMTLELADRLITRSVGVAEDVFVKTGRALIDVYEGELTLRVGKEAVTFNLDQTLRYFTNYDVMLVNRIDLIDVACEEYCQEVLGFFMSGNPTPSTELIISNSSPTLTPFGDSDYLLEETDAFLAIDDVPNSPKINESYYDSEGDILLLEEFLNNDPSSPPLFP